MVTSWCGSEPNRPQAQLLDSLGELIAGRHLVIAEPQPHRTLCALGTVGFGGARVEVGDQRLVCDELAAHGRRLPVVQYLCGSAPTEVVLPGRGRHRIQGAV